MKRINNNNGKLVRIEITEEDVRKMTQSDLIQLVTKEFQYIPSGILDNIIMPLIEKWSCETNEINNAYVKLLIASLPITLEIIDKYVKNGTIVFDECDVRCLADSLSYVIHNLKERPKNITDLHIQIINELT